MRLWLALVWMAGAFPGGTACAQTGARRPVTLAVHILVPCGPGAGQRVKLAGTPGSLCLDRTPFLTEDDVQSAEIQMSSKGHPMVFLTFRNEAAVRELQITQKNIGNRVAILLDGKVVSTPAIAATSRLLYIDGNFTRPQADQVVMAFNRYLAAQPAR